MRQGRAEQKKGVAVAEMSPERFDAVVVGAGIMGSCAAFELSRRGLSILLLEQFDFLHHLGSSHGESRGIRATYPEAYYTPMALASLRLWLHAESLAGYSVVTRTSHLDVGPSRSPILQLLIANCRAHSVPHRVLDPRQLAAEFSGAFRIPDGWVGVVSEIAGVIKPTKAVAMFQALARVQGAVLRDRVKVVGVRRAEDGVGLVISTEKGVNFLAGKVVVATGAWTRELLGSVVGLELPIQPVHVTACYWKVREGHEAELTPEGGFPTFVSYGDPYLYSTPSMEFPGLLKVALHGGKDCDPDRRCWVTDVEEVWALAKPFVEQVVGGKLEPGPPVMTQPCLYSMTPDGDYVIDYVGGELGRDVVVATGFSGHGFKMGPLVGKVAAEMALGEEVIDVDLRHFRARRFESDPRGNAKEFPNPITLESYLE